MKRGVVFLRLCDISAMALCLLSADTVTCGLVPEPWHVPGLSPAVWCHSPEHATCFPWLGLRGSGTGCWGKGPWAAHDSLDLCPPPAWWQSRQEGGRTKKANETDTYLSPDQLPNTNKEAPEPLLRGQRGAAEGLSTKLDDDNLQERGGREAGPAGTPTDTTLLL